MAKMRQAVTTRMMRFEIAETEPVPAEGMNGSGTSAQLMEAEDEIASNERDPENPETWVKIG